MDKLLSLLNWLLPLLYLGLLIDYGATFLLRTKEHARNPWLPTVLGIHALFFILRAVHLGYPPLGTNYEILSLLALSTALAYGVVEIESHDRRTGMFVFLLVFLFQYSSSVFLADHAGTPTGQELHAQSGWGRLHILPAVLAYTGFSLSAVYGLLHLRARHSLKEHRLGILFDRLPPLDLLGKMSWYALLFGFAFITVAIGTGPLMMHMPGHAANASIWDPRVSTKIIVGSIAWAIYMVAIVGKLIGKWSPSRICRIAVEGFLAIMVLLVLSTVLS